MVAKLSFEQLSALRRIDSPTISNAIETFKVRPRVAGYVGSDIRCIFPELPPTVGYAITCTVDSTTEGRQGIGFQKLYDLLTNAAKPAIVVMQDVGPDRLHSCHAGEVMSTLMKRLGAVAILGRRLARCEGSRYAWRLPVLLRRTGCLPRQPHLCKCRR